MTTLKLLKKVVAQLQSFEAQYAVCGALAASYYRSRPRLTNDVDIAINMEGFERSKTIAEKVISKIGYHISLGRIAGGKGRLSKSTAMVIGHQKGKEYSGTIDFLLPAFPWVEIAVTRAQDNLINFGFDKLPTLTPEDVIIAKTFALAIEPDRFQDMDDLKSIFSTDNKLDLVYLVFEFERLHIKLPKQLIPHAPAALRRISKGL